MSEVITNGKATEGDEYSVTKNHLAITIQNESYKFEIKKISQEGVVEWEEQEKYSVAFQYQGKSYEFPSLYPYYPDIINAIKEARIPQDENAHQVEKENLFPEERSYPEIITTLEKNERITIHERISLVIHLYKQILSDLKETVGAPERTNANESFANNC